MEDLKTKCSLFSLSKKAPVDGRVWVRVPQVSTDLIITTTTVSVIKIISTTA